MLTRIRNSYLALHKEVAIPKSKAKRAIAQILHEQGYVQEFNETDREVVLKLKYMDKKPVIIGLKRKSRSGLRKYVGVDEIPKVQNGLGICILSTSKGIVDGETARQMHVGGELMCEIW
jgi:small subunit ribosomal protein S8